MEIKPFKNLPLIKFFQHDLERIKMAYRLSKTITGDIGNIRAGGDEVEHSVKNFFKRKLSPRYLVCDGHIVDYNLKVSPQYDVIIAENSYNPVLFSLADKSDLIFYEPVYCFGEIKRSYYNKNLLQKFSDNIRRFKSELSREPIPPNYIETGNTGIMTDTPLTSLPIRNPLLTFMFFVSSDNFTSSIWKEFVQANSKEFIPNFIVFLDQGIIVNVSKEALSKGKLVINLYPEYEEKESTWVKLDLQDEDNVLIYQYLLVLEHLNSSIVKTADVRSYTNKLFDFSLSNIQEL